MYIDNDGNTDLGKIDSNNDGYIDGYDDDDYSYGIVSYQTCEGIYVTNNILSNDFSQNGIYEICAVPNTVSSESNLDHDLDDTTNLISSVSEQEPVERVFTTISRGPGSVTANDCVIAQSCSPWAYTLKL